MTSLTVDVAVIGAGTAGLVAFRAARKAGANALLIEAGAFGTTCAHHGCMPSKLLLAAAHGLDRARGLAPRGIAGTDRLHALDADVLAYVRVERDRFVAGVLAEMRDIPPAQILRGHARFVAPTQLAVDCANGDRHTVTARSIVIATGSLPVVPQPFEIFGTRLLTSDALIELDTLPRRVAVFGAGPIGLELGQALGRLGVAVHLFEKDGRVGGLSDPAVRDTLVCALRDEFPFDPDAIMESMTLRDGLPTLHYRSHDGTSVTEQFDAVLVATGRRPALEALALEATDLALDEHGVGRAARTDGAGHGEPALLSPDGGRRAAHRAARRH